MMWVTCPFCHKKQFPVTEGAVIIGLQWRCKASYCKQMFMVNTEK